MRARIIVIGIAAVPLLLAACASTQSAAAVAPPVKVIVTADDAVKNMINRAKLEEVTEAALAKYASHAGAATLTIHFTAFGHYAQGMDVRSIADVADMSPVSNGHTVPSLSMNPWSEGVTPTVGSGGHVNFTGPNPHFSAQLVTGTYTITDANGVVRERKPFAVSPDDGPSYYYLDALRVAGEQLARRVAKVMRRPTA